MIKQKIANIKYTLRHKKAYLQVERELLGKNTIGGYLHDIDKVLLYILFSKKVTSIIHRRFARHHVESFFKTDFKQAVIDWECSRITKPDKPLTAMETMEKYYPEYRSEVAKEIKLLGL